MEHCNSFTSAAGSFVFWVENLHACANPVQALHGGCHMVHYSMALVVVCNYAPQLPTLSPLPHTPALQGWASPCSLELNKFNLKDCEVWAAM